MPGEVSRLWFIEETVHQRLAPIGHSRRLRQRRAGARDHFQEGTNLCGYLAHRRDQSNDTKNTVQSLRSDGAQKDLDRWADVHNAAAISRDRDAKSSRLRRDFPASRKPDGPVSHADDGIPRPDYEVEILKAGNPRNGPFDCFFDSKFRPTYSKQCLRSPVGC